MSAAVVADRLCVSYGERPALDSVSFAIQGGSICGLVGPNGAGKTTTLRILATDLVPSSGRVEILGRDALADYASLRPRLGFMSDSPDLFEDMTLVAYLEMFAALYGIRGRERRTAVDVAVELAGVAAYRQRPLANLSKGEAQRVALARTLVHDPELLILDEPADGLDPRGRVELRELLVLLKERGKTVLVSSHILPDLEAICDMLVLLDRGAVVFAGSHADMARQGLDRERVQVAFPGADGGRLDGVLASSPGVTLVRRLPDGCELDLAGGAEAAAALLARLVHAGVHVSSFHRRSATLEELFLKLTSDAA